MEYDFKKKIKKKRIAVFACRVLNLQDPQSLTLTLGSQWQSQTIPDLYKKPPSPAYFQAGQDDGGGRKFPKQI